MHRAARLSLVLGFAAAAALAFASRDLAPIRDLEIASLIGAGRTPAETVTAPVSVVPDQEATRRIEATVPATGALARTGVAIEVARLDPSGASVIAGRAPAGSRIVVMADGVQVGEATASEDGQWSAIVISGIGDGVVVLTAEAVSGASRHRSAAISITVPKSSGKVELAAAAGKLASRPTVRRGEATPAEARSLAELAARVEQAKAAGGRMDAAPVPIPITFVTGEATMTPHGARAASLLAEYLRITAPKAITLSGHADERGSDTYNLVLSERRLEAIERYLRSNGFSGRLSLLAKGRSEPYRGIDRASAPRDEIQQADRRVELRLSE